MADLWGRIGEVLLRSLTLPARRAAGPCGSSDDPLDQRHLSHRVGGSASKVQLVAFDTRMPSASPGRDPPRKQFRPPLKDRFLEAPGGV